MTSPISPASRRNRSHDHKTNTVDGYNGAEDDLDVDDGYEEPEEEDAFESMQEPMGWREETPMGAITIDRRMAALPEIHRDMVHQFVHEAKKAEEKLRNADSGRKAYFTELNFREMAINWTTSVESMRQIPNIDVEKVNKFGGKFIPLIQRYFKYYNDMMSGGPDQDRDIDQNHANVINLASDSEEDEGEDLEEIDSETEAALREAESSKYFPGQSYASSRKLPWAANNSSSKPAAPKSRSGGGFRGKGKGKGAKRKAYPARSARTSTGSASGPSTSGVRKSSYDRRPRAGKEPSGSGIGSYRGRGGGSIGMMPT